MFKPTHLHKVLNHQDKFCSNDFTLISWNIAKLSMDERYKLYIQKLIAFEKVDFLLLQEVKKSFIKELEIDGFSYVMSPNMQTKKHLFGVLSAFKIQCLEEQSLLTQKREAMYATHKVSLITKHKTLEGKTLLIVNLHAINFVHNTDFKKELLSIKLKIKDYEGALIVAGDFNTWNHERISILNYFSSTLGLTKVEFSDETSLKKVFSKALDYIFFRGIELKDSKVIDSKKLSDHNPILARFSFI